jgi:hypothetical protein
MAAEYCDSVALSDSLKLVEAAAVAALICQGHPPRCWSLLPISCIVLLSRQPPSRGAVTVTALPAFGRALRRTS